MRPHSLISKKLLQCKADEVPLGHYAEVPACDGRADVEPSCVVCGTEKVKLHDRCEQHPTYESESIQVVSHEICCSRSLSCTHAICAVSSVAGQGLLDEYT